MKDMGEASYVLVIEIHRQTKGSIKKLTEVIYRKCTKDV
jgi:hypothetical protein